MKTIDEIVDKHFRGAALFPLGLTTKFPAVKGWNNSLEADLYYDCFQPLPATLTSKAGKDLPLTGFGVNLRQSGLMLLDLDVNHTRPDGSSADGITSWDELAAEHGVELPPTLTINTMSGGKHYWFRRPDGMEELPELIGKLGDGIDFKASGMAVGPLTYAKKWNDQGEVVAEGTYTVATDHPIAPIPEWLEALVRETYAASRPAVTHAPYVPNGATGDFPDRYAEKALESAVVEVVRAAHGARSNTLNSQAYGAAKAGVPIERVVEELTNAARSYGDWPEDDLRRTILRSATEGAGAYTPRALRPSRPVAALASVGQQPVPVTVDLEEGSSYETQSLDAYTDPMDMTDMGMAIRFLTEVEGKYCFASRLMGWKQYANGVWVTLDEGDAVVTRRLMEWCLEEHERIGAEIRAMDEAQAAKPTPDAEWKQIKRALEQSLSALKSSRKVSSIWNLVLKHITVGEGKFDSHPRYRCMANGVFDLATNKLLPHSPDYYFTKQTKGNWTERTSHPLIDLILEALPTPEKREALTFFLGAGLNSSRLSHKKIFSLVGEPDAGKTKIQDLTRAAVGGYASKISTDALVSDNETGNRFSMATFNNVELAFGAEPSSYFIDPNKLKELTGESDTKVQIKHAGDLDMRIISATFVSSNGPLRMKIQDQQVMFRIVPVIFPYKYTNDKQFINDDNRRAPDARVDQAVEAQEVQDVWASILMRHAASWYQASSTDRDILEARYLDAFECDREAYTGLTDRMAKALEEVFFLGDHGRFMTRADVKDALAEWWTEEFGGKNTPSKDKLFDWMMNHPKVREAKVTFEKHTWVKAHLKQDSLKRADYRGDDITRKPVKVGDLVVGLRLKTDADRLLESGKLDHVVAAQTLVEELEARLFEAKRMLEEQRQDSDLAATAALQDAPVPDDVSGLSNKPDDFDLDEESLFSDEEATEVDF